MNQKTQGISVQQLYEAYSIAAELVSKFGDPHLPIFQRLHAEIKQINQTKEIKKIALNIYAANNKT